MKGHEEGVEVEGLLMRASNAMPKSWDFRQCEKPLKDFKERINMVGFADHSRKKCYALVCRFVCLHCVHPV